MAGGWAGAAGMGGGAAAEPLLGRDREEVPGGESHEIGSVNRGKNRRVDVL